MKPSKALMVVIAAALALASLLSCARRPTPTLQPTAVAPTETPQSTPTPVPTPTLRVPTPTPESGTLVVLVADSIDTLDPYRMVRVHPEGSIASHLWDTLTRLNADLQVEPSAAESWWMIGDCTWEFSLRPDVVFHDGERLDAETVRYSIERSQSLPGSTEAFAREVGLVKVEAVSDRIVRLTTLQPVPDLAYHLAFLEILPRGYYSTIGADQAASEPVGSGPYRLEDWTPGEQVTLASVPSYWRGTPRWSHIIFRSVPALQDRLSALSSGEASLVTDLAPIQAERWDVADTRLETVESTTRMLIGVHAAPDTPLADRRVRQALNYGVDVTQIAGEWLAGYGERYGSWVNPPDGNAALEPWPYDPDLARELLDEAGYADGLAVTLTTPSGAYYQDAAIAQSIAQQWGEIGVQVQVEEMDWAAYAERLLSEDVPALFLLAMNSRGNALQDVRNLAQDWPYNPTSWQDPLFEQQLQLAATTFDPQARAAVLDELQALAYDQAPWIWLWRPYRFYGVSQRLDWTPRRDGLVNLYEPQPR